MTLPAKWGSASFVSHEQHESAPPIGLKHTVLYVSVLRSNLAPKPLQGKGWAEVALHITQR